MAGPDHPTTHTTAAAAAVTDADTVVLNRAVLHDALTHNQTPAQPPARREPQRAAAQPTQITQVTDTTAGTRVTAAAVPDTGPWITLMILGLGIVTAMLIITLAWT